MTFSSEGGSGTGGSGRLVALLRRALDARDALRVGAWTRRRRPGRGPGHAPGIRDDTSFEQHVDQALNLTRPTTLRAVPTARSGRVAQR